MLDWAYAHDMFALNHKAHAAYATHGEYIAVQNEAEKEKHYHCDAEALASAAVAEHGFG